MDKKKILSKSGIVLLFAIMAFNFYMLYRLKSHTISSSPFNDLAIDKPTIIVIFDENECVSCVQGLLFLNELYASLKNEGRIDMKGIILTSSKADPKGISKAFIFPVIKSNDFEILKRLNMNQTPLIIGLSKDHRIYYCDLIPFQTGTSLEYVKKGVLDRLYYSLEKTAN